MLTFFKWLMLLLTLGAVDAVDAEESELIERSWDFGLGIGYGNQTNPFVGSDDVPGYLTLDVAIYGEKFFFDNGDLGFTLVDRSNFGLNILANYSSERIYYSYFNDLGLQRPTGFGVGEDMVTVVPSEQFLGTTRPDPTIEYTSLDLPDRDFAVNMGLEVLWDTPKGQLQWHLLHDVSGAHKGLQMELDYSNTWVKGRWAFKPNLGLSWKSADLVNYYYGLDESTNNFELQYQGKETTHVNVGALLSYRINNNLSYVNQFEYTFLGSAVRNSPLIDENHTQSYFSGIFYSF